MLLRTGESGRGSVGRQSVQRQKRSVGLSECRRILEARTVENQSVKRESAERGGTSEDVTDSRSHALTLSRSHARATFTTYTTRDGLPSDQVTAITEDSAGGIWFATFIVLRNFKDDRGRSFLERGLEHHSPRAGRGITLLAMYVMFQFVMWVPGNLPQGLASFYAPQWPKMPPHLLNNACDAPDVAGTRYGPCPGSPGFGMPGRHSLPARSP